MNDIPSTFHSLAGRLSELPGVLSVGRSGGGRKLPASGADGDIDVFLYCDAIPDEISREAALASMGGCLADARAGVFSGGRWGAGDFARIEGVDTWLMFFTVREAQAEVESILNGDHPGREGGFYPTGRCAMYLGMEILCDRTGFLASLKERLSVYPDTLAERLARHHLYALDDTEDFERAVARKDSLFYHFALENALDHYLQALFALNKTFFPSRKRSLEYIARFEKKPEKCEERLLDTIRLGGAEDGIEASYAVWTALVRELHALSLT